MMNFLGGWWGLCITALLVGVFSVTAIHATESQSIGGEKIKTEETHQHTTTGVLDGSTSLTQGVTGPSESGFGGSLDLRPSWMSKEGSFRTENEIAIEYRFDSSTHLGYAQEFQTNLYNPKALPDNAGGTAQLHDGYLKVEFKDLWKSSNGFFLSDELRAYVPTHTGDRDAGLITTFRNYFKLHYDLFDSVELTLMEVPILHVYNRPGAITDEGAVANPLLENRFYLVGGLSFFNKALNIKLPIILENARHANFQEGAKFNNSWSHKLWIYPEITYSLTSSTAIGLGYYSENLIADDFSALTVSDGFDKGITQLILQQSL